MVSPIQNDVGDLKVVGTQHHHVSGAVEDRVSQLVQLDVVRLRRTVAGSAPGVDCVNRGCARLLA